VSHICHHQFLFVIQSNWESKRIYSKSPALPFGGVYWATMTNETITDAEVDIELGGEKINSCQRWRPLGDYGRPSIIMMSDSSNEQLEFHVVITVWHATTCLRPTPVHWRHRFNPFEGSDKFYFLVTNYWAVIYSALDNDWLYCQWLKWRTAQANAVPTPDHKTSPC